MYFLFYTLRIKLSRAGFQDLRYGKGKRDDWDRGGKGEMEGQRGKAGRMEGMEGNRRGIEMKGGVVKGQHYHNTCIVQVNSVECTFNM